MNAHPPPAGTCTIVDYGMGNLGSIQNMLARIEVPSVVTGDPGQIAEATMLILPGVGAFDAAMARLAESGLTPVLRHKALVEKVPFLGICLGMQILFESSEEGRLPGLGWIPGRVLKFEPAPGSRLKVPQMGWNSVARVGADPRIPPAVPGERFYFVHSYYARCTARENVAATAEYGISFDAIVTQRNILACQFHPEKSHHYGMRFLRQFCAAGAVL